MATEEHLPEKHLLACSLENPGICLYFLLSVRPSPHCGACRNVHASKRLVWEVLFDNTLQILLQRWNPEGSSCRYCVTAS